MPFGQGSAGAVSCHPAVRTADKVTSIRHLALQPACGNLQASPCQFDADFSIKVKAGCSVSDLMIVGSRLQLSNFLREVGPVTC